MGRPLQENDASADARKYMHTGIYVLHRERVLLRIHRNTSLFIVIHTHFIELMD